MNRRPSLRDASVGLLAIIVLASHAGPAAAATAPDTTITTGPSGAIASKVATFTFVSSISGSTFKCKLAGQVWSVCASPKTYSNLTQGAHTFRVKAKKGTLIDKTPAVRTFTVDTVAPNTYITGGPSGTTLDVRPEFTFNSSQANSTFECSIDLSAFTACISPFWAIYMTLHFPHTIRVRAIDGAGNVDATPAARTFTIEPVSMGGAPYAQAAAELYFPASVDFDMPASCGGYYEIDCPGGTPLPPSEQIGMQTTSLSVVYPAGLSRFDVTATISVKTVANIGVRALAGIDCTLSLDASKGSVPNWTVNVRLQFSNDPASGDLRITPAHMSLTGVQTADWQLSGHFLCLSLALSSALIQELVAAALESYWASVGVPLCEHPAPALVGPCPQ